MKTFPELPRWTFYIQEVSANVYRLTANNIAGQVISTTGTEIDLDAAIEKCKADAIEIDIRRQSN